MSSFVKTAILQVRPVVVQQVRFRNRLNIQKPQPPHFEKAKFIAVTNPIIPKDTRLPIETCSKRMAPTEQKLSPLDKIYAGEMLRMTRQTKLVAVFAQNPSTFDELHQAKILFFKGGFKMLQRGKHIIHQAYTGTQYENLLCLTCSPTIWVFNSKPNVEELLKINEKVPLLTLLGGMVCNKIMSVSQLKQFSMLPDLKTSQALLVQTLNSAAQDVVRGLNAHQTTLSQHLQSRIDLMKEASSDAGDKPQDKEMHQTKAQAEVVDTGDKAEVVDTVDKAEVVDTVDKAEVVDPVDKAKVVDTVDKAEVVDPEDKA